MKKTKEDHTDDLATRTINDALLEIFTKLYVEFRQHAHDCHYPHVILQQIEDGYEASIQERRQMFSNNKEFHLMDYYDQRPNNLWLQIEKEMISEVAYPGKRRKDTH
jgi:hypothetical protein